MKTTPRFDAVRLADPWAQVRNLMSSAPKRPYPISVRFECPKCGGPHRIGACPK